jgi:hypothetical protein
VFLDFGERGTGAGSYVRSINSKKRVEMAIVMALPPDEADMTSVESC